MLLIFSICSTFLEACFVSNALLEQMMKTKPLRNLDYIIRLIFLFNCIHYFTFGLIVFGNKHFTAKLDTNDFNIDDNYLQPYRFVATPSTPTSPADPSSFGAHFPNGGSATVVAQTEVCTI